VIINCQPRSMPRSADTKSTVITQQDRASYSQSSSCNCPKMQLCCLSLRIQSPKQKWCLSPARIKAVTQRHTNSTPCNMAQCNSTTRCTCTCCYERRCPTAARSAAGVCNARCSVATMPLRCYQCPPQLSPYAHATRSRMHLVQPHHTTHTCGVTTHECGSNVRVTAPCIMHDAAASHDHAVNRTSSARPCYQRTAAAATPTGPHSTQIRKHAGPATAQRL
jgi:hypothetical protein